MITDVIARDNNMNYYKEQLGKLFSSFMNHHNSVEGINISG